MGGGGRLRFKSKFFCINFLKVFAGRVMSFMLT